MKQPRLCVFCKHFYLWMGEAEYSEYTPGSNAEISCRKGRFENSAPYEGDATDAFAELVKLGRNCPDFEERNK